MFIFLYIYIQIYIYIYKYVDIPILAKGDVPIPMGLAGEDCVDDIDPFELGDIDFDGYFHQRDPVKPAAFETVAGSHGDMQAETATRVDIDFFRVTCAWVYGPAQSTERIE